MSKIDYQALRDAAVAIETVATPQKLLAFRMKVTPQVVLALLDERERNQQYIKQRDQENEEIALTVGKLRVELEEVKQHAEELSETKAVRNQWRPDICPITGRTFFMWI
ncbi:ead/Ea22-like family protein, partial [Escherichia coli]